MSNNDTRSKTQKGLSNDLLDGIAAVLIIAIVVTAVGFWLHGI